MSRGERLVDGPLVVGPVPGEARDIDVNLVEEIVEGAGIVGLAVGHHLGSDDTVLLDADVELAPAADALAAVYRNHPLTLAGAN